MNDYLEVMSKRGNLHLVDGGETNSVVENFGKEICGEEEKILDEDSGLGKVDKESVTKDITSEMTEQEYAMFL